MQNNAEQVKTIYKISQVLSKAFLEVNSLCVSFLADDFIQSKNNQKSRNKNHNKIQSQKGKQQPVKKIDYSNRVESQNSKPKPAEQKPKPAEQKPQAKIEQTQKQAHKKKESHPQRPKQPLSAFFLFQSDQKQNLKKIHPNAGITQLAKMSGQIWKGLQEEEKNPYVKKSEQARIKYDKQMKKFYDRHPEQKSKKQLKKQKAESRNNNSSPVVSSPVQKAVSPAQKQVVPPQKSAIKKPIIIEEEQDSI